MLNYLGLISENGVNSDNALLLAVAALSRFGVRQVSLAGFDGFRAGENDYYSSKYAFAGNRDYKVSSNETTIAGLRKLSEAIKISFVTDSLYSGAL